MARSERMKAVDALDSIFSKYIRLRDSDKNGYCKCVTCPKTGFWTKDGMQAGHFQTRTKYSTRWDEKNVHAQCAGCNMVNGGQQYVHGIEIDKRYGEGTADNIVRLSNNTKKFSTFELREMVSHYKEEVLRMMKEKGL